jgi:mannitol/fructose-specific phosphotransferase system IIA component (Ntr-type)
MWRDQTGHTSKLGSLAEYTRPGLIVPQLQERDTAGVVNELTRILHREGCVPDVLAFYHAALNHEFLVNSATESGIAVPHARLNSVTNSGFAFGRATAPLMWGPRPSRPVEFVFLLSVPATDAAGFLQLLSALARFGQEEDLLAALRAEPSSEAIFNLFKRIRVRQG